MECSRNVISKNILSLGDKNYILGHSSTRPDLLPRGPYQENTI